MKRLLTLFSLWMMTFSIAWAYYPGESLHATNADDMLRIEPASPPESPLSPIEADDDLFLKDPFPGVPPIPDKADDAIRPDKIPPSNTPLSPPEVWDIDEKPDTIDSCLLKPDWWQGKQDNTLPNDAHNPKPPEKNILIIKEPYLPVEKPANTSSDIQNLPVEDNILTIPEPYSPEEEQEVEQGDIIINETQAQQNGSEGDSEYESGYEAVGFPIDLLLVPDANDSASGVYWEASLPTGVPIKQITSGKGQETLHGVRVPALSVKPESDDDTTFYFDIVLTGFKPNYLGKTSIGKWLGLGEDSISFVERVFFDNFSEVASSYTRNMRFEGEPLTRNTDISPDQERRKFPTVLIEMRPYDETASLLKARTQPKQFKEEIPFGADCTDGGGPVTVRHGRSLDIALGGMLVAAILYYGLTVADPETAVETISRPQYLYENTYSRAFY